MTRLQKRQQAAANIAKLFADKGINSIGAARLLHPSNPKLAHAESFRVRKYLGGAAEMPAEVALAYGPLLGVSAAVLTGQAKLAGAKPKQPPSDSDESAVPADEGIRRERKKRLKLQLRRARNSGKSLPQVLKLAYPGDEGAQQRASTHVKSVLHKKGPKSICLRLDIAEAVEQALGLPAEAISWKKREKETDGSSAKAPAATRTATTPTSAVQRELELEIVIPVLKVTTKVVVVIAPGETEDTITVSLKNPLTLPLEKAAPLLFLI